MTNPILNDDELESLKVDEKLKAYRLPIFFDVSKGVDGSLKRALDRLCEAADDAVRSGSQLLILSDRLDELVFILVGLLIKFPYFLLMFCHIINICKNVLKGKLDPNVMTIYICFIIH